MSFIGFGFVIFNRGRFRSGCGNGIGGSCDFGDFMSVGIFFYSDFMSGFGIGESDGIRIEIDESDFFSFRIDELFHFRFL